jgi:SAM-dependent methyltransferase
MKKSLQYNYPKLYSIGISLLQVGSLRRLRNMIGQNKVVFEVACGYGRMKSNLHSTTKYSGIDLNERFIRYGQMKGRDIKYGDIFDKKSYKKSDIILACDIIHHLSKEKNLELFSILNSFAKKKIVILEPRICILASGKNIFSKALAKLFSWIDSDGVNKIERWFSDKEYKELFYDFSKLSSRVASYKVSILGAYYIVEYQF